MKSCWLLKKNYLSLAIQWQKHMLEIQLFFLVFLLRHTIGLVFCKINPSCECEAEGWVGETLRQEGDKYRAQDRGSLLPLAPSEHVPVLRERVSSAKLCWRLKPFLEQRIWQQRQRCITKPVWTLCVSLGTQKPTKPKDGLASVLSEWLNGHRAHRVAASSGKGQRSAVLTRKLFQLEQKRHRNLGFSGKQS